MLVVEDVVAAYGTIVALKGISLEVRAGEVVALIGANGAGKTTTLKTIAGAVKPRSGQITFEGQPIAGLAPPRIVDRGVSLVPEGRRVFTELTVEENLRLGAFRRKGPEIRDDIEAMMGRFPILAERRKQLGGTLSGGEQQMLAIARGLMARPKLLMLDEPSLGLAPRFIERIFDIIEEISAGGMTILLVEQNARQALAVADWGYVLQTGEVVLSADAESMAADPSVQEAYLGGQVGVPADSLPSVTSSTSGTGSRPEGRSTEEGGA
jgi:branched-chain amino acid transport system ATP-binding protein